MRTIRIATAMPFTGAPKINLASVFGASPNKPFLLRIPVTGERPISYSALDLPEGLVLNDNIISGSVVSAGNYQITLIAQNRHGVDRKKLLLEIRPENVLVTPLLGFTTWNAFGSEVSQASVLNIVKRLTELGITEYGYRYINIDSGWQSQYGGKFDAVMPNQKFPNMKYLTDTLHALGLKCGIYSTPMLNAWGCPKEFSSIPGCTTGEPDKRFASTMGGIGVVRKEKNNVLQWTEWGFDYLKYDWTPTDPVNAELMRSELMRSDRDFGFCVNVQTLLNIMSIGQNIAALTDPIPTRLEIGAIYWISIDRILPLCPISIKDTILIWICWISALVITVPSVRSLLRTR